MNNEIYITLKGGEKVTLNDRVISWTDKFGARKGAVIAYGKSLDPAGNIASGRKDVFLVKLESGSVIELRPHELRDIVSDNIKAK